MTARNSKWMVIVLAGWLLAGCGDEENGNARSPASAPTPQPCPQTITYTLVGQLSDIDLGWTGRAHDQAGGHGASVSFGLTCPGAEVGQCGSCQLRGPVQSTTVVDNHRCFDAPEIRCQDDAACPQGAGARGCGFFLAAPLPMAAGARVAAGAVPICAMTRIAAAVSGTANPDTGAVSSDLAIELALYAGIDPGQPCPRCTGADLGGAGTCGGGPRNGHACTVDAMIGTFGTSFDCPPDPDTRVGASTVPLALTSGRSTLAPTATCTGPAFAGAKCHCTDQALPNECGDTGGDGRCVVDTVNDQQGVCIPGPIDPPRCYVEVFRSCGSKDDCPGLDDSCSQPLRECLADANAELGTTGPIVRIGAQGPTERRFASTFCLEATSNAAINEAVGLPGPGALLLTAAVCTQAQCP